MDRLNQFSFKEKSLSKLSTLMKNSDFEPLIAWIEDCFDIWNEPIKALGNSFLEEQDSYFLDLNAQIFELPERENLQEKIFNLQTLYHSLKQPATLKTLYYIGLIYFTPLSLLIIENKPGTISFFGEPKNSQDTMIPQNFIKILECIAIGIEYHIEQIQTPALVEVVLNPKSQSPKEQTGILVDENGIAFVFTEPIKKN